MTTAVQSSVLEPDRADGPRVTSAEQADPHPYRSGLGRRCDRLRRCSRVVLLGDRVAAHAPVERFGRALGRARERVLRPAPDDRLERHHRRRDRGVQHAAGDRRWPRSSSAFSALRRRFREAAFLTLALVVEITVFLSVTFVVAPASARRRAGSTRRRRRRASRRATPRPRRCCSSASRSSSCAARATVGRGSRAALLALLVVRPPSASPACTAGCITRPTCSSGALFGLACLRRRRRCASRRAHELERDRRRSERALDRADRRSRPRAANSDRSLPASGLDADAAVEVVVEVPVERRREVGVDRDDVDLLVEASSTGRSGSRSRCSRAGRRPS